MELQFLTWTNEYAIGHTGLDAEHRHLIEAINEICSIEHAGCTVDQLRPPLKALTISAVEHFKHENTLMRELSCLATQFKPDCPAIQNIISVSAMNEHCAGHAQALLQLEAVIHASCYGACSDEGRLGKMLTDWFVEHALKHDADLRDTFYLYFAETKKMAPSNNQ